ncbi:hypothetical protein IWX90DRAFT_210577 [Phyllosticta citrichinensis]|uniref:Transmembrane protein n=1 Tax=Phyllosticta citrichinensis TaxID=1130410 RepID=A0ABR1XSU5_9PEZI
MCRREEKINKAPCVSCMHAGVCPAPHPSTRLHTSLVRRRPLCVATRARASMRFGKQTGERADVTRGVGPWVCLGLGFVFFCFFFSFLFFSLSTEELFSFVWLGWCFGWSTGVQRIWMGKRGGRFAMLAWSLALPSLLRGMKESAWWCCERRRPRRSRNRQDKTGGGGQTTTKSSS